MAQALLSSEMLAKIADGSPIPSFVINKQHKVTHWNTAIEALCDIEKEAIIGTDEQWRAFYAEKRPVMADLIVDGVSADEIEVYYRDKCKKSHLIDGAYEAEDFYPDLGRNGKWLHFTASPIRDNNGEIIGAIETLEDITERKRAEEELRKTQDYLGSLLQYANAPIIVWDRDRRITIFNTAFEQLTGYIAEEVVGQPLSMLFPEASRDESLTKIRQTLSGEYWESVEIPILRKDGESRIALWNSANIYDKDGKTLLATIAQGQDITERKSAEDNLRYYLQEITRAQEEERKRIARELHDDTAQVLGSLSRQLDNFIRKKHGLASNEVFFLKDLQAQLNRGVEGVHRFSQALRLSVLDDLGLIPALRSLAKDLQESNGIGTDLKVLGGERRFSPEVELLLFRIVQEALNNIRRHAQASEAQVVMEFAEDRIKVSISDNGRGFELSGRVDDLPRSGKLGLAGIQERVRLLGGTIQLKSTPGKGTTLIVEVPN